MDTKGIVNLDYVVHLVLMDKDDPTMTNYKKFLQYAILGYQDLNLYTIQSIKVAYLTVKENKTVDLPDDYITYTKIGYNDNGKIRTLTINEDLMLPRQTDDCGNILNDNSSNCGNDSIITGSTNLVAPYSGYYYSPHYRNGQFVGELYGGYGGRNSAGYYRIDQKKRQIAFSSEVSTNTIILEYKSSGVDGDGSTVIPRETVEALRAYIHWQSKEYNDKVAQSEKTRLSTRYYTEFEKLRGLEFSFTIEEYYDSVRSTYRQTPKR